MSRKLRVGILADSTLVPAWSLRMVERILEGDYAEVTLLVTNGRLPAPRPSLPRRVVKSSGRLVYLLYTRLERLLRPPRPDAQEPRDLTRLLPDVEILTVEPRQTRFSDYFPDDAVETIKARELDVMIRLGFRILRGEILNAARFGIWSFHHGDNQVNRGGPAGFWEVAEGWPVTGSILQILSENLDGGLVLDRSWQMTDPASVKRNLNGMLWKSLSMMPRNLRRLHRLGGEAFMERARERNRHPAFYSNRLYQAPRNRAAAVILLRQLFRWLGRRGAAWLTRDQWILLYALRRDAELSTSFRRFKRIVPPADRFWADPHVVFRDGTYHVFIEEYLYATGQGRIAVLRMSEDGSWERPVPVLERPYHLSYPFVFEHDGSTWMVPESEANRTVELYRATDFPTRWEKVTNLMEGVRAVDATLIHRDGRWWMFVNMAEEEGGSTLDELFLFSSETLVSDAWQPHPLNPIVSDARRARPAGRIFERNGGLYRPAQNSSWRYGHGMVLHEIVRLDPQEYEERPVATVLPDWDRSIRATHTLSFAGGLTVIDGQVRRRR